MRAHTFVHYSCKGVHQRCRAVTARLKGVRAHAREWLRHPPAAAPGRGIIRRAIEDIFAAIEHDAAPHSKFLVRASYLQIYNEVGTAAALQLQILPVRGRILA